MKKLVILAVTCACALGLSAAENEGKKAQGKKKAPGQEQKQDQKKDEKGGGRELTKEAKEFYETIKKKYDKNGNNKLDREERAAISEEDLKKMRELGIIASSSGKKKQGNDSGK